MNQDTPDGKVARELYNKAKSQTKASSMDHVGEGERRKTKDEAFITYLTNI
jgi:hypothetical protein